MTGENSDEEDAPESLLFVEMYPALTMLTCQCVDQSWPRRVLKWRGYRQERMKQKTAQAAAERRVDCAFGHCKATKT